MNIPTLLTTNLSRKRIVWSAGFTSLLLVTSALVGQQSDRSTFDQIPANSVKFSRINNGDPSELSTNRTLDRLNELQQQIQIIQNGTEPPVAPNQAANKTLSQLENETRVRAINQRISIIKEMLARHNAAAEAARLAAEKASIPTPELMPEPTPESMPPADPMPPIDANPDETELPSADDPAPEPTTETPIADGIQVLSSPVNSFELANSLFATGNYAQALKNYESLLENETDEVNRDWLRCLTANCYRIAGNYSDAEKLYRDVAASKHQSYPSDQSKWYLDHLTRRKRITNELHNMDIELQALLSAGAGK